MRWQSIWNIPPLHFPSFPPSKSLGVKLNIWVWLLLRITTTVDHQKGWFMDGCADLVLFFFTFFLPYKLCMKRVFRMSRLSHRELQKATSEKMQERWGWTVLRSSRTNLIGQWIQLPDHSKRSMQHGEPINHMCWLSLLQMDWDDHLQVCRTIPKSFLLNILLDMGMVEYSSSLAGKNDLPWMNGLSNCLLLARVCIRRRTNEVEAF